jgi:hypothetical protein
MILMIGRIRFYVSICLQEQEIHLSIVQSLPITGVVVVSTPARLLWLMPKGVSMFMSEASMFLF